MKKYLIFGLFAALIVFSLVSCRPGENQPVSTPDGASYTAAPEVTEAPPTVTPIETPSPTQVPDFTSAVEFLSRKWVISKAEDGQRRTKEPEKLEPGEVYTGGLPYNQNHKYNLLILDKEQSSKILTMEDITEITYLQSECLPIMLRWDNVSVLDINLFLQDNDDRVCRAFFYYLDDATVIILNDSIKKQKLDGKPWILVIPKGDEDKYPSFIPPKGTFVNRSDEAESMLFAPYYRMLLEYFESDSVPEMRYDFTRIPYRDYMKDYEVWMTWRLEHPDFYKAWKRMSYPEKTLKVSASDTELFRVDGLAWCETFRDGEEEQFTDYCEGFQTELPRIYCQIKQYGVPKEEMLEFVKWMNWSGAFEELILNEDDVEILYSGDEEAVIKRLLAPRSVYFEGKAYSWFDIIYNITEYDLGRILSRDSFLALSEGNYHGHEGAWDEYARISEEDAGVLGLTSAERVLNDFMEFYREVRYSPDALAGAPATDYNEDFFSQTDYTRSLHFSNKSFSEIRKEALNIFVNDLCERLNMNGDGYYTVFYTNQFCFLAWDGAPNQYLVSDLSGYYDGPVALYGDGFKLEDHIKIESSDGEHAAVTLTARNRSGEVEKTYSVEFSKVGGRWLISGGTVFELVETFETVRQFG